MKVTVIVEKGREDKNFSCFTVQPIHDNSFYGSGTTARAAIKDMLQGFEEAGQEDGLKDEDVEFEYKFDIGSFFDYYPLNATAFATYIGMNPSLLRQYVSGLRVPHKKQLDKITKGMETIILDIRSGSLIDRPVLQYV